MQFFDKNTAMKKFLDKQAKMMFGSTITDALNNKFCVRCKTHDMNVHDEKAMSEYYISGLCPKCQDEIFINKMKENA